MSQGWISLHRKLQNNPLWSSEPFTRGQAWVDLLLLANHEEGYIYVRDHKIDLKRGDVGWSQNRLSERWQWSRTKIRKFLNDLEKEQQIKQLKSKSYTVIRLINYNDYQQKEQQKDKRKTRERQQKDTNNNVNNENNEKNIYSDLIFDYKNIQKMQQPLTVEQGEKLIEDFGIEAVEDVLMQMENWKNLKNNLSTNLTVRNWMKRRTKNDDLDARLDKIIGK